MLWRPLKAVETVLISGHVFRFEIVPYNLPHNSVEAVEDQSHDASCQIAPVHAQRYSYKYPLSIVSVDIKFPCNHDPRWVPWLQTLPHHLSGFESPGISQCCNSSSEAGEGGLGSL